MGTSKDGEDGKLVRPDGWRISKAEDGKAALLRDGRSCHCKQERGMVQGSSGVEQAWVELFGDADPADLRRACSSLPLAARLLERAIEAWLASPSGQADQALLSLACALPAGIPLDLPRLLALPAMQSRRDSAALAWVLARAERDRRHMLGGQDESQAWWKERIAAQVALTPPWPRSAGLQQVKSGRRFTLRRVPSAAGATMHFSLSGEQAEGSAMAAGSLAELAFRYEAPGAGALASVSSPALDTARMAQTDILLLASARGAVALEGPQFGRAQFREGRLLAPVGFQLRAGPRPGDGGLHVDFLVRGESVHQVEIALQVTPARAGPTIAAQAGPLRWSGAAPDDLLVLAARAGAVRPQQIVLSLGLGSGGFSIGLADLRDGQTEFADDFLAPDWGRADLEALLRSLDAALGRCYEDAELWGGFDGILPDGDEGRTVASGLARTCEAVAAAGALLNARLRSSPRIAAALDYVESNAAAGAVISISTDNIFLPWEILYPRPWTPNATELARKENPLRPEAFWGARFAIETEKRGVGSLTELRARHRRSQPRVSLNLNPDIRLGGKPPERQPLEVQREWARALQSEGLLEGIQQSCGEVRSVLQDGASSATLLYVYCHGDSPHPLLGTSELLQLDADCRLQPEDLQTGPRYGGAPIVILNSCRGAVASPLAFTGFLKEFRRRGALGMIAATYAVPIAFAARFGLELVRCTLNPRGSLAAAMLALRRVHLLERGNPVPLFYTLQCHLDAEGPT